MENKVLSLINLYKKDKLGHFYIIETNDLSLAIKDLEELIKNLLCFDDVYCKKCLVCRNFKNYYSLIEKEDTKIKKEQIHALINKCSSKPYLVKNHVYVIKEADLLTKQSSNALLKLLEEPYENCYAFMVAKDSSLLIETIRSRAEIVKMNYKQENNSQFEKEVKQFFSVLEKSTIDKIQFAKRLLTIIDSREGIRLFLVELFNSIDLTTKRNIKRKKILKEYINKMDYNVNVEMQLDSLLLEMSDNDE